MLHRIIGMEISKSTMPITIWIADGLKAAAFAKGLVGFAGWAGVLLSSAICASSWGWGSVACGLFAAGGCVATLTFGPASCTRFPSNPMIPISPESPTTSIKIVAMVDAVERPLGRWSSGDVLS